MRKTTTTFAAVLAMAMGLPGGAYAQPDDRPGQRHQQQDRRDDRRDDRHDPRQEVRHDKDHRGHAGPPQWQGARHDVRGGPGSDARFQHYQRGQRLPVEYRSHQYVVNDWRGHHLKAPPRGYHWVQNGSDYLLVAIATGLIAQVLLSN